MAVTLEPIPGSFGLLSTGDIETVLTVPYDDDDRFFVGFSDGTLLQGTYDDNLDVAGRWPKKVQVLFASSAKAWCLNGTLNG